MIVTLSSLGAAVAGFFTENIHLLIGGGLVGATSGAVLVQEMEDSLDNLRRLSILQKEL